MDAGSPSTTEIAAWLSLAIQAVLLAGVFIAYLTYRQSQIAQRRSHTVQVMSALNTTELLEEANWCAIGLLRQGSKRSLADLSEEEERCLVRLLNFYEFTCTSLKKGVLDKATVRHLRGGAMVELYGFVQPMLAEWRGVSGRDEIYAEFQDFSESYELTKGQA